MTGGYYYMGAMPAMYEFRFDVKIPLQRERRAAAVAEQLSTVEQAQTVPTTARGSIFRAAFRQDFHMASTSVRLARLYQDTVLPQARLALESSHGQLRDRRGRFSLGPDELRDGPRIRDDVLRRACVVPHRGQPT